MRPTGETLRKIRENFCTSHKRTFADVMRCLFYGCFCLLFLYIWRLCVKWCSSSGYLFTLDRIAAACMYFAGVIIAAGLIFDKIGENRRGAAIFFISFSANLMVIFLMGQNAIQIYDYRDAFLISFQSFGDFSAKSVIFPNWAMYPVVLKLFHAVFGANELTGITLNAVMVSASASMVYDLSRRFIPAKTAVLAALLFAGWPSFMEYLIMLSPEFLFIFTACLSAELACRSHDSRNMLHKSVYAAASAALLAFSNFFKAVVPVILIALLIVFFLLFTESREKILACLFKGRTRCLRSGGLIILSAAAFLLTNTLCHSFLEEFYGAPLNDSVQSYYMATGLSSASRGFFAPDVYNSYVNMLAESDYDFASVSSTVYDNLWRDILENKHLDYAFFRDKLMYGFGNDDYTIMVDMTVNDGSIPGLANWAGFFAPFNQIWYLLCVLCIVASSANCLAMNDKRLLFFCAVAVWGMILLLMLTEVQPRYKCVFYPLLSILAADGIRAVGRWLK